MKRLKQYLNEMKVIKGSEHNYWTVARWSELSAVFHKMSPLTDDEMMAMSLSLKDESNNCRVLRGLINGGKLYVWDGYDGNLHDTAAEELALTGATDEVYFELATHELRVEGSHSSTLRHDPTLHKVLTGCPVTVRYK